MHGLFTKTYLFFFLSLFLILNTNAQEALLLEEVSFSSSGSALYLETQAPDGQYAFTVGGEEQMLNVAGGRALLPIETDQAGELFFFKDAAGGLALKHISVNDAGNLRIRSIPLWLSIIPPLLAIILALVFKEVIVALFAGIWSGAFIAGGLRFDSLFYLLKSFFATIEKYVVAALNDTGHISVIVFSLLIGGMVAIISKNGGMAGVVKSLSKYAKDSKSSQFITWLLGVAIFFDDYANTLIVGNTMRSVTDKFKISREKLAYIVDSTAAPVSAIAFITTWIGAELGYIADGMAKIPLAEGATAYSIFLSSLKYSYYPILTLIFILIIIFTKRDFGPMLKAETRARTTGKVSGALTKEDDEPDMEDLTPVDGAPLKWQYAFFPVATVIFITIFGLLETGITSVASQIPNLSDFGWGSVWSGMDVLFADGEASFFTKLGKVIGEADSYSALLWASLSGVVVAIAMTLFGRVMKLFDTMHWLVTGFKTMMPALIILTLAWALAICTDELHTADFLSNLLTGNVNPYVLPVIIFILAAMIAFSTGSSWSTMAILYPIAIPTTYAVCSASGLSPDMTMELLLNVIATVLASSVLGDHCSPISDTTILSSLASDCNHIDHVRTQMPYALTVGAVSITCVFLSTALGGNGFVNLVLLLVGVAVLYLVVRKIGVKVDA